jgi:hypothetical protein
VTPTNATADGKQSFVIMFIIKWKNWLLTTQLDVVCPAYNIHLYECTSRKNHNISSPILTPPPHLYSVEIRLKAQYYLTRLRNNGSLYEIEQSIDVQIDIVKVSIESDCGTLGRVPSSNWRICIIR